MSIKGTLLLACAMLFGLGFCGGCSTIVTHTGGRAPGEWVDLPAYGVYRGVRVDGGFTISGDTPAVLRFLCIVDFPLSTVADTIVLPYDLTTGPGSLKVNIVMEKLDPSVTGGGAKWRLDVSDWQNRGATISGLEPGEYVLEFSPVKGWQTPDVQYPKVAPRRLRVVTGIYKLSAVPGDGHTPAPH
jgi:uncharacterized protein YceK